VAGSRRKLHSHPEEVEAAIERIAARYASLGYHVERGSNSSDWRGLEGRAPSAWWPDLIAVSRADRVIVEVKSRTEPDWVASVASIAEIVETQLPEWRFELVVTDADKPSATRFQDASRHLIERRVEIVSELLGREGQSEAVIVGWAAFEAALDQALKPQEPEATSYDMLSKLKYALALGLIDETEEQHLNRLVAYRNAIAHGRVPSDEHELSHAVDDLHIALNSVPRLLQAATEAAAAAGSPADI
jgi:hypothetical protein